MTATIPQAQTLLRSINYSTGEMITSKLTPVVACSWLYIYPVLSGEMNYTVTGLSLGMSALDVYPPGLVLISMPWTKLSTMLENPGGDECRKKRTAAGRRRTQKAGRATHGRTEKGD